MRSLAHILFIGGLFSAGCTFPELDLNGLSCDCAAGWRCDEATNLCVERTAPDGGPDDVVSRDVPRDRVDVNSDAGRDSGGDVPLDTLVDAGPDAPTDAGGDAGLRSVCDEHSGALFCEDFETPGLPGWSMYGESGGARRVTSRFFGGSASARATTTSMGSVAALAREPFSAVGSGEVNVRLRFWSEEGDTATFFTFTETASPFAGMSLSVADGRLELYSSEGGIVFQSPGTILSGEWNCAALNVVVHPSEGSLEIALNRGLPARRRSVDTLPPGGLASIDVGISFTPSSVLRADLYVDDVVISRSPLPCD